MATVIGTGAGAPVVRKEIMQRPAGRQGTGSFGRPVTLDVNYFRATITGLTAIYMYDIEIHVVRDENGAGEESKDIASESSMGFNRVLFGRALKMKEFGGVKTAYDGRKICYTPQEFPVRNGGRIVVRLKADKDGVLPGVVKDGSRVKEFEIRVKLVATHDGRVLSDRNYVPPQDVINALDVVIAEGLSRSHVEVGRSFYTGQGAVNIGMGCSAWFGFYQSLRMTQHGLCVNLDASITAFYDERQSVYELAVKCNGGRGVSVNMNPRDMKMLEENIDGVRVKALHSNITYRCCGLSTVPANKIMFEDAQTGRRISVADYMTSQYNVKLEHSHDWPCIKTSPTRQTFVPMELLVVVDKQRRKKTLTPDQTAKMIKAANKRPSERRARIAVSMKSANADRDGTDRAFGVKIDSQMVRLQGRQLIPPALLYKDPRNRDVQIRPSNGVWNMAKNRLYQGSKLESWFVVNASSRVRQDELRNFIENFVQNANANGMPTKYPSGPPGPPPGVLKCGPRDNIGDCLRVGKRNMQNVQMIMIIKDGPESEQYNHIKHVGDIELGVPTQCVLSKNMRPRGMAQLCSNIVLKVNAKLNGRNVHLGRNMQPGIRHPFEDAPFMVLGADVTHPSPGSGSTRPSVAALVGSMDRSCAQYAGTIRNQSSRQEIIQDIGEMFGRLLKSFYERNNRNVPRSLIFYRDGVSEGQFQAVLEHEVEQLQRACVQFNPNYRPKLTFVIVAKRHHTRFFPTQRQDEDRSQNVRPGVVVDTIVTHPHVFDFYLNSHSGIQGTSRPAKYSVLLDENNFTADQLQMFSFGQCHSYARCCRSVSIVASAYYAHLLAFRGRAYIDDFSRRGGEGNTGQLPPTARIHDSLQRKLFFV